MTTCLVKSCSFGLSRVPFVNCCPFMYLVISLDTPWQTLLNDLVQFIIGRYSDPVISVL